MVMDAYDEEGISYKAIIHTMKKDEGKMILLLTKKTDWCFKAANLARIVLGDVEIQCGDVGDSFPELLPVKYDAVISFLSPWIIPEWLLDNAKLAINFHPGTADYPGYGCYNFALYEGARYFGAVCHHMKPKVDTGLIIRQATFPVSPHDTVETLKLRTMVEMLALYHQVISDIANGGALEAAEKQWTRRPFTKRELDALCEIKPDMDMAEINRRKRATIYPGKPGPYIMANGEKYFLSTPDREPIA